MNVRQARWLVALSEFNFEINYIKGKENKVVDALSRRIQINHLAVITSYTKNLMERVKSVALRDEK